MIKRIAIVYFLCSLCTLTLVAQQNIVNSLEQVIPGQGQVIIHQDPALTGMIGSVAQKTGKNIKAMGYRVQVYMGNNSRKAKEEANLVANNIKSTFPELQIYVQFDSPRWVCRIGDYRSMEEADVALRRLKETKRFKEISVVRVMVNLPE